MCTLVHVLLSNQGEISQENHINNQSLYIVSSKIFIQSLLEIWKFCIPYLLYVSNWAYSTAILLGPTSQSYVEQGYEQR